MPVLPAEATSYPENLLDGPAACLLDGEDRRWWVVYTRSRQEKALARDLFKYEVPFYLPTITKDSLIRGRKVTAHVPLFSNYIFLFANDEQRVRTLTTNRISNMLPVADCESLERDLRQVRQLIACDAPLTVERRLQRGQRVRVKRGAFAGLEGDVIQRRGVSRLLVAVTYLQQGVSVEIDDFMLEPI